ncbi:MAG: YbjN domain-containing protein [Bdellovibrionales bacterium]
MKSLQSKTDKIYNPLDIAELVIMDRDWVFDRPADGELVAEVTGMWCNYRIWFTWQKDSGREDSGGLTLSCAMDNKFQKQSIGKIYPLLALANEKLWIGHFGLCTEDNSIVFRHSLLLRDGAGTTGEHLQELLDLAISECERFYPAFQSVVWGGKTPAEAIEIALFETIAEA